MGSEHCSLSPPTSCILTMLLFVLLAGVLAVAVEGSYYGYDGYGYGGYGGYGYGGYGYPSYGGYGYGGYGSGYGYGGYGSGYGSKYKRSTDHQQVHVSGYAGQPTVVPTNAYGGYSSYAPAYYGGYHDAPYAPGYGYSSYAPSSYAPYSYSSYNYAPYGYPHGSRYPYAAGSTSYAPGYNSYTAPAHNSYAPSHSSYAAPGHSSYASGHSSYAPGHQTHGYGNVQYAAGTPFMYSRAPGYGPQGVGYSSHY